MKLTATRMPKAIRWQETFAALRHPNYRLWFLGQLVSMIGTWMQNAAQGYLVYELTRSPAYLGYVGFAAGFPSWLFTLYGGVVADRISRRNLLVITQAAMMVLAFLLAGLVFSGHIQAWHIVLMAFLLGTANAFDAPTRQAFVVELVERQDLTNAIALNATMFNSAAIVGPAVAGITYALLGPAWCFTINGLSFIAVITALLLMSIQPVSRAVYRGSALSELREGLQFVVSNSTVRILIGSLAVVSVFSMGIMPLLPAWAVNILDGDVKTNGLLLSARGIGALIGALSLASLGIFKIKGKLWTIGSFAMPVVLLVFAFVRWLPLSMLLLAGLGTSQMILFNSSNAMVQMRIPDHLRGRVMSIFTLSFFGFMPLGSLVAGTLADRLGEPATILISALVLLAYAAFVWLRLPALRSQE